MTAVVSDWKSSDLILEDYCENHKITLCKFSYWNKKLISKKTKEFSKVEFIDTPTKNSRNSILDSFKTEYSTRRKFGLYERADEQPGYIAVLNKRPLATTALVYNAKDSVKINPKKIKLSSSEVIIGADVTFEVTDYRLPKGITKIKGNADKSNIRWCLHIQGVHAKGAYSIIKNGTTVESETDFTTNATQADLDSKSYLYADAEIDGSSNKLTIQFSKHLAGKKVQIEAFRETPSIIQPPNLGTIKSVTIKAKEKATLIQKLTSDLFIEALCEEGTEIKKLEFVNKKKHTKLKILDWHDPLIKMELRGWYGSNSREWAPERSGYLSSTIYRNSGKHEGLDLYSPVGPPAFACVDGEVYLNYFSATYGNSFGIKGMYKGKLFFFLCPPK